MSENKKTISLNGLDYKVDVTIFGENQGNPTILERADAQEDGEASIQIYEGKFYEYEVTNGFYLQESVIVTRSKINRSTGRISPNIYVGTLTIDVLEKGDNKIGEIKLEVQSEKTEYRTDYRNMLGEIAEKCTDLLLQHSSPVSQFFEPSFKVEKNTLYQRFAFLKAILDSKEFDDSIHKILAAPVTKWKETEIRKDIRSVRKISNTTIKQIASATNRIQLPDDHYLNSSFNSIPSKINLNNKTETFDTAENRFIKYALVSFLSFISGFRDKLKDTNRLEREAILLEEKLEQYLNHSVFKEISNPTSLHLNSPVLQRKEGYREVLRVWLMFDLAAKLIWHGGDDVYSGDKRDVAVLYEYWLFFKLLDLIREIFNVEPKSLEELIVVTKDGLGLQLKQGKYFPIKGEFTTSSRKLNIEFSYNKTFRGNNDYPKGGSWTRDLRPDYTLSIWPHGVESEQAEIEELIVHIHFDAKYKVDDLSMFFGDELGLEDEKEEQKKGTYKRADILKMHTYRDAIRRTAGAYVLYPGSESNNRHGFHEILPGLGAFPIRPSKLNDGTEGLRKFLKDVVEHFINRASQREKISYKTYDTYKDKKITVVNKVLPEPYGINRDQIPDETFVLIGFYRSAEHLQWILANNLYNTRTGSVKGSLKLSPRETGAKYLLLYTNNQETQASLLLKINDGGPKIFSKQDMIDKAYPNANPRDFYLVYDINQDKIEEFENIQWNISLHNKFPIGDNKGLPFAISMVELMEVVIKTKTA